MIKKIFRRHSKYYNTPNYGSLILSLIITSVWWKYTQLGTKFLKGFPRESLSKNIYEYVLSKHIIEFDFLAFNFLAYKMILDVNMLGSRMRYQVVCKYNTF